mmetsp:Transcript_5274/g.16928  ORF Transcript_5274/g.16928 Transcript_5274/m.16928 type:complete len:267 (+) Transcript_5274:1462-2262(+)
MRRSRSWTRSPTASRHAPSRPSSRPWAAAPRARMRWTAWPRSSRSARPRPPARLRAVARAARRPPSARSSLPWIPRTGARPRRRAAWPSSPWRSSRPSARTTSSRCRAASRSCSIASRHSWRTRVAPGARHLGRTAPRPRRCKSRRKRRMERTMRRVPRPRLRVLAALGARRGPPQSASSKLTTTTTMTMTTMRPTALATAPSRPTTIARMSFELASWPGKLTGPASGRPSERASEHHTMASASQVWPPPSSAGRRVAPAPLGALR